MSLITLKRQQNLKQNGKIKKIMSLILASVVMPLRPGPDFLDKVLFKKKEYKNINFH